MPGQAWAQDSAPRWSFTSLVFADLWFHGMALVDPVGPGPHPLYDPAYPSRIRQARETAQLESPASGGAFDRFRSVLRRDPAFEVMHFVPLYFPQAGRTEVLTALTLLSNTETGIPRAPSAHTSFGLTAVGSVLSRPDQRAVLGQFVQALESEWQTFFEDWWRSGAARRLEFEADLQRIWQEEYAPPLAFFLRKVNMEGGVVAVVPAIGPEGRVFAGAPRNSGDNVLVLSHPPGSGRARAVMFAMLREISFPLVRQAMARASVGSADRDAEESLAARAAVRSGALVLQKYRPEDLEGYQTLFLSQLGISAPPGWALKAAFEEAYPLDPALADALRAEILEPTIPGGME